MFLITTAEQRFWKTDEPVLCLGEWCKLFSQRDVWKKLTHEVLPYHWDDRKKLHQDYLYLDKLYEQTLFQMRDLLNQIHRVDHSLRYWRIVIGPWLYWFIQILYDRYQSVLTAIEFGKVTNTLISKYDGVKWLSQDFPSFVNYSINNDLYNHYLYSLLIEFTGKIPFEVVETTVGKNYKEELKGIKNPFVLKKIFIKFIGLFGKLIPDRLNRIVLISSYLNTFNLIKLQVLLKQLPYLFPPDVVIHEANIDLNTRKKLFIRSSKSEFEQLLGKMIKEQIPLVYLEGYAQMNKLSLTTYPKKPRVIVTANAYQFNEAFKFWAGYHCDNGAILVCMQHGGHNGTGLWSSHEKHETKIGDKYYTWGWNSDIYRNTKPLAAAKLNGAKNIRSKKDGRILLVLVTMPRYSYHMYSAPVAASGTLSYFNDQYRFVRALSEENQRLLLARLYHVDRGWSQMERWGNEFSGVKCYQGGKEMLSQLKESRLFIGTYNATTYLQTFVANFPTVMFWNPSHWELRPSAQPYFDELRRVGIFHETPESAAAKVNKISHDPASWWNQPEIQRAKDKFCFQFARTSDNWLDEWKKELLGLFE